MRYLLLSLWISVLASSSAHAQGVATFTYQRGALGIIRSQPPLAPAMPWQAEGAMREKVPAQLDIEVDIRPSDILYQRDGWMNLSTLGEHNGILFIFDPVQTAHVSTMAYTEPLDVLWISSDGLITSIAPNISLAQQQEPLADKTPSKAILLLAGGSAQQNSIRPGDRISGSDYFQPAPSMLSLPQPEPISDVHK